MKPRSPGKLAAGMACLLLAITLMARGKESASTSAATSPATEGREFVVEAEMPYRAGQRMTGIFINAFHLTRPVKEVVDSIKSLPKPSKVTVIICRRAQEQAIRDFWDVSDEFIFESLFMLPDWNAPPEGALLWPDVDHPMINYVRKIRTATKGKRVIVSVPMTCREVWGVPRERPELFDELKWMTMAVIGANYQGILWGHVRREEEWNEMVQELAYQIKAHASDLGEAAPVDWVEAPQGQPVSALASEGKLFITMLNTDFMKISEDRKEISGALNPGRRRGNLMLNLPDGVIADAAVTLDGSLVEINRGKDGLTCPYDFNSGGEMIIVTIKRTSATQPPSRADHSDQPSEASPVANALQRTP